MAVENRERHAVRPWEQFVQFAAEDARAADDVRIGTKRGVRPQDLDDYSLVVIDEAHNLRNPTTLTAYGVPGYTYITERSTNLSDWVSIVTNVAGTDGVITVTDYFSDQGSNAPPAAFYRLRWQQ